jgi:hypothetical protein
MNALLALFLIVFEQVPDGLATAGYKTIAGIITFIYLAGITFGLFTWINGIFRFEMKSNLWRILGGYVLLRFAIADLVFNISAGLPLFYIGTTKIYDQFWQWFFNWTHFPDAAFLGMIKLIALLIGITWLLRKK